MATKYEIENIELPPLYPIYGESGGVVGFTVEFDSDYSFDEIDECLDIMAKDFDEFKKVTTRPIGDK